MTIQTQIHDGIDIRTRTYQGVIAGINLSQLREGFLAQRTYNRYGLMFQLKGTQRILIGKFGKAIQ